MSHIKALELLGDDTSSPARRHDAEGGLTAHAHPGVRGGSSTRLAISSCSGTASGSTSRPVRSSCLRDRAPYPFTGTVKQVVFEHKPATLEEEKPLSTTTQTVASGVAG
jgi:hypothetical protein